MVESVIIENWDEITLSKAGQGSYGLAGAGTTNDIDKGPGAIAAEGIVRACQIP